MGMKQLCSFAVMNPELMDTEQEWTRTPETEEYMAWEYYHLLEKNYKALQWRQGKPHL